MSSDGVFDEAQLDMGKTYQYEVVNSGHSSPLRELASWFHQDWYLMSDDHISHAAKFVSTFEQRNGGKNRRALLGELRDFVSKLDGLSDRDALARWHDLGADGWDKKISVKAGLMDIISLLEEGSMGSDSIDCGF